MVIDRRADPRAGYRAVHVVVRIDGLPVEVQFRTELQHRWAQIFERLADEWGRQIRYDEDLTPDPAHPEGEPVKEEIIGLMMNLSTNIAGYEELSCSDFIKRLETEVTELQLDFDAPEESLPIFQQRMRTNFLAYRAAFHEAGSRLQSRLDELADRVERVGRAK
jgi:ppGpp synthetase/RelA/SpoT-type nucleotidyltranferase